MNLMISIVIPAYNEEKLISECLESLRKQDFKGAFEVILADNGSTDGTAQIAKDRGARVISCTRKGVSYARQAGAEAARGEIIVQADADTIYPQWWLRRIQEQFDKHRWAVAIAGTFIYRDPPWWSRFEYFLRILGNILSSIVFGRLYVISGANLAFYKKSFVQIGGYRHNVYSADQIDIATRLGQIGKIIYDRKSYGLTSARSVAKPAYIVFADFLRHLGGFIMHIFSISTDKTKKQARKITSISTGTYLKVVTPVLLISFLCYGYFVPASPVFGKVYYKSITPNKVIALTFDDGPNEPYTTEVLDILNEYNVRATFFLVGYNVKLYPQVAQRMLKDEDVIANHTYSHNANHALTFDSPKDIALAQQTIISTTGVSPHLFRGPHGKKTPWELEAIKKEGLVDVFWSISTSELGGRSAEWEADDIIKKARPGGIILLHDGYGTEHNTNNANKSHTVEMLPDIIRSLRAEGYRFVTVPELLNIPAYNQVPE
jgi:peptidoglycan-N-acetylglucosamine deacetylase